ncbi:MAG TPA: hypothetical protein VK177_16820, partial [Flavobacteriales bacterium]|nr:hypothetical protein [Flavobacteriales bacterium]
MLKHWPLTLLLTFLVMSPSRAQQVKIFTSISNDYRTNGNMISEVKKIVCDTAGNSYVYLKSFGQLVIKGKKINNHIEAPEKAPSYLIVKLSKKGNYKWGLASQTPIADFDCDPAGNLYIAMNDNTGNKVSSMAMFGDKAVLLAEGMNNAIIRLNTDGEYVWSRKLGNDFYLPRTTIKYNSDGKLYCLASKNGTRLMDHVLVCLAANGREEFRSEIFNQYIDVFDVSPEGKSYIAGYDYKLDDKNQIKYPFEVGRYTLLEIDENGNPKKLFDKKFEVDAESRQRADFYINQVAFDKENAPLFFFNWVFDVSGEITVADKKFKRDKGEFLFVQLDKKGNIIYDYQLKTGANAGNRTAVPEGSLGLGKACAMTFTKNNTWLVYLPVGATIPTEKSSYKPARKNENVFMEFDPAGKGTIKWVSKVKSGSMGGGTTWCDAVNDSIFIGFSRSNDTIPGIDVPYCTFATCKVKIKKEKKEEETTEEAAGSEETKTEDVTEENSDSTGVDSTVTKETTIVKTEEV